ncbi:MAG: 2-phospho-L-lactate guanylyltransferase, partial [Novosphingobium sp.]
PETIELLPEPEGGLNAAVSSARETVAARGATRIVTLAGDLPQVTAADVGALATLLPGVIGIAPDRHGTGTNALSLPLPEALNFIYAYGPGSCVKHKAEAARLGLTLREINSPGLARDIDEPADLADAQALLAAQEG